MSSENGWNPSRASGSEIEWVTIPGTNVRLQFLKGAPLVILRAFAADFNAYIEPLRDADSAAYTATNSVATSNHLNGTAMDLNWQSHPFRVANAGFDADKIKRVRALQAFYEGLVFWANDWDSPKDAMHWQMGYGTFGSSKLGDFISRKIQANGFSTYQRNTTGGQLMGWKSLVDGKTYTDDDAKTFADYHNWRIDKLLTQQARAAGLPTSDADLKKV